MDSRKLRAEKLRQVLPYGLVTTKRALKEEGFTVHQVDNYVKSGELKSLAPGVYTSPMSTITWESVLASMDRLGIAVSLGALSSLEQAGYGHYLSVANSRTLYVYSTSLMPGWFRKILPDINVVTRTHTKLLHDSDDVDFFLTDASSSDHPAFQFRASVPELAILEYLHGLPKQASFEHAELLMESLTTLSPRKLNRLLERCNNIKVKRLFFWLAHRHNHTWLKSVDYKQFDLGTGKRVIAVDGALDTRFNITVPKFMHAKSA